MKEQQKKAVMNLLWDSLRKDPEHNDRRQTGWGTKTQKGLAACIERIVEDDSYPAEQELLDEEKRYEAKGE